MKSILRPLTFVASIIFIGLIFVVLYHLYFVLPDDIATATEMRDTAKIDLLKREIAPVLILVGIELALGLFVIVLFSFNSLRPDSENVVYIEKFVDRRQERASEQDDDNETSYVDKGEEVKRKINSLDGVNEKLSAAISGLCNGLEASIGAIFLSVEEDGHQYIEFAAGYAYQLPESKKLRFEYGEGIAGQVAKEGKEINISSVPQSYITVVSGLGKSSPEHMIVMPIKSDKQIVGVIEVASFTPFGENEMNFVRDVGNFISMQLNFYQLSS